MSNSIVAHSYNADSIEHLTGLDPVRLRPAMYVGNTTEDGLHQLAYEIVDNSVDEHLAGYCNRITVSLSDDCLEISVCDNGRGIPVDLHKKSNLPALEVVMTFLHAGGKFNDQTYKISGGLHGVGASVVVALSELCVARVFRNGKIYQQKYSRGHKTTEVEIVGETDETGTEISFKADSEIFSEVKFDSNALYDRLKERAYLNPGLTIEFRHKAKSDVLHFEGGTVAFVEELLKKREVVHDKTVHIVGEREVVTPKRTFKFYFDAAFRYTKSYQETLLSFANNINTTEGGTHVNAFKQALLKTITEYIIQKKLLADLKLSPLPRDIAEGLVAIVSVKVSQPEFEGQTKRKLGSLEIRDAAEEICRKELEKLIVEDKEFIEKVVLKIVENIRARDAAAKARNLIGKTPSLISALSLPSTLTDCTSEDRTECEIFLCEGESAAGTMKMARNKKTQAVLPSKGKPPNSYGVSLNKILSNEEIGNIVSSLGIDPTKANTSCERLRYGKIVLTADADVDGGHIVALWLTFFFRHMRSLLVNGHVYMANPPLFKVTTGKDHIFLLDDRALQRWQLEHANAKYVVQRYKGLGENSWQEIKETVMNLDTRVLTRCAIQDAAAAEKVFFAWMGPDVGKRKDLLFGAKV